MDISRVLLSTGWSLGSEVALPQRDPGDDVGDVVVTINGVDDDASSQNVVFIVRSMQPRSLAKFYTVLNDGNDPG